MATAAAPLAKKPASVIDFLNSAQFKGELAKCVRTSVKPETWLRIVQTYIRRSEVMNPDRSISQCTPMSVMAAVLTGTQLGLEFGREAHLVPFRNKGVLECQFIPDYKGLIQLVHRSGLGIGVIAVNVFEEEPHTWNPAAAEPIRHEPRPPSERGKHIATYCIARDQNGRVIAHDWLWHEDIEKVRGRSKASGSSFSPWSNEDDYLEMAKKTAFKRLSKWLPMSAELQRAVALDNQAETGESQDFIDVAPLTAETLPESRTAQAAAKAAKKVEAVTGKAPATNGYEPPEPSAEPQPEPAATTELPDDPIASGAAVQEAINYYVTLPQQTKERLKKNWNFKSSAEFKEWKSSVVADFQIAMEQEFEAGKAK